METLKKYAMRLVMALMMCASPIFVSTASAALSVEQKIAHFGSPIEWKAECSNWIKVFGVDQCIGHTYKNLQHEYFVIANGPDVEDAVANVVRDALGAAAVAAAAAYVAAPSPEPAARAAAAYAAAKVAFVAYLSTKGQEALVSQYEIRIDHRTSW